MASFEQDGSPKFLPELPRRWEHSPSGGDLASEQDGGLVEIWGDQISQGKKFLLVGADRI